MKTTTTLRILFTLAILAGLAAAPSAQTFRWEAGRSYDAHQRAERAIEQARRSVERRLRNAERRAESIQRQVQRRVDAQLRRQLQNDRRLRQRVVRSIGDRGFSYGDNAGAQVGTNEDPCSNRYNDRDDDYYRHCEVRDSTMPAGPLNVDAGTNGGISIEAWDRNEIR
ncbi:MAG TPA: hypothetical protein VNT81_06415, partial [Vicinamibacterales bacterium]|nr:hypothetical protein [Vicinamibacterales bacterium]